MKYNDKDYNIKSEYNKKFIKSLKQIDSPSIKTKLLYLKDNQNMIENLTKEMRLKISKIELEYEKLFTEIYANRQNIINGENNLEDSIHKLKLLDLDEKEYKIEETGIPNFWLTAIENVDFKFPSKINTKDREILKHLKVETYEDHSFKIIFRFEPNIYLNTTTLFKHFILNEKFSIYKIISNDIEWSSKDNNPFFIIQMDEEQDNNKPCSNIF